MSVGAGAEAPPPPRGVSRAEESVAVPVADRAAAYYEQGARFCKWRSVVSIPDGPSRVAVTD